MKRIINFRIAPFMLIFAALAILAVTFCSHSLVLTFAVFAVIALLSVIFIKKFKGARGKPIACILVFFLFMGLTTFTYAKVESRGIYSENSIIEADIDMLTQSDGNGVVQTNQDGMGIGICLDNIIVDGRAVDGKAYAVFSDPDIFDGLRVGDRIKFKGNIAPQNFVVTDTYSVLNYRDGIYHYIFCKVDFDDEDFLFTWVSSDLKFLDKIKLKVKSTLYSNTRDDTAGFLYAMTFGDKSGLESQIKNSFSYAGTAHVFAVSGLHVGIIVGLILWVFKKVKLNNRFIRLAVMSVLLLLYSVMCGFSPPIVRASIMTILLLLARALGKRNDGISSMSIAACIILLVDPITLFDIGFLMSFFAMFGIFTLYKPLSKLFKKLPKKFASMLATSISVNVALLPLMMYYFSGETMLFIISNLILLPILAIIFPIYLLAIIISSIMPFMGWTVTLAAAPFTLLIMLIEWISKLPTLLISFDADGVIIFIGLLSIIILSQYVIANKKFKRIATAVFAIALLFATSTSFRLWGANDLYVYCFTDKYDCQYLLVDNAFGGEYLVVNDRTSSDSVDSVLNAMSGNKFSKVDGIIVVGEVDGYYLAKLQMYVNCPYVYSANEVDYFSSSGIYVGTSVVEKGLVVGYLNSGIVDMVSGSTTLRVVADEYYFMEDDNYEILVTYCIINSDTDGKYIVCDTGFNNSMKNYVPSTFTFELNNDRIKVQSSWRY